MSLQPSHSVLLRIAERFAGLRAAKSNPLRELAVELVEALHDAIDVARSEMSAGKCPKDCLSRPIIRELQAKERKARRILKLAGVKGAK